MVRNLSIWRRVALSGLMIVVSLLILGCENDTDPRSGLPYFSLAKWLDTNWWFLPLIILLLVGLVIYFLQKKKLATSRENEAISQPRISPLPSARTSIQGNRITPGGSSPGRGPGSPGTRATKVSSSGRPGNPPQNQETRLAGNFNVSETRGWLLIESGRGAGTQVTLKSGDNKIGRDARCVLSLSDPLVSREHALVRVHGNSFTLHDLASGNGTLLNDKPLYSTMQLLDGDEITVGDTVIIFKRS